MKHQKLKKKFWFEGDDYEGWCLKYELEDNHIGEFDLN